MVASSGRSSMRCFRICFVEGCATPSACHRPRSARSRCARARVARYG
jgi:hypothetical protein